MDLTDDIAHLALAYVAAVQRQGICLTTEQLEAYVARPGRRPGIPAVPERAVVTTNLDRALRQWLNDTLTPFGRAIAQTLGTEVEQVPGSPGTPTETVTDWLTRLQWLATQDRGLRITPLGEAVLRHLEQESLEDEIPVGVVLSQGDELATARVMQQLADIGPCAVIDQYFSMDSLLPILHSTEVDKILMGSNAGAKLAGVETALRSLKVDRRFEVRKSDVFHDRFVIPHAGPVWALGTSFTGLSKRLSIMVKLDDDRIGAAIRGEFDSAWDEAEVVALGQPEPESPSGEPEG